MENLFSELMQDFGASLFLLGWSMDEVNAAVSYVRRAFEREEDVSKAIAATFLMRKQGRLSPND